MSARPGPASPHWLRRPGWTDSAYRLQVDPVGKMTRSDALRVQSEIPVQSRFCRMPVSRYACPSGCGPAGCKPLTPGSGDRGHVGSSCRDELCRLCVKRCPFQARCPGCSGTKRLTDLEILVILPGCQTSLWRAWQGWRQWPLVQSQCAGMAERTSVTCCIPRQLAGRQESRHFRHNPDQEP